MLSKRTLKYLTLSQKSIWTLFNSRVGLWALSRLVEKSISWVLKGLCNKSSSSHRPEILLVSREKLNISGITGASWSSQSLNALWVSDHQVQHPSYSWGVWVVSELIFYLLCREEQLGLCKYFYILYLYKYAK